ncbi:MAG: GTP cyclohydrolase I FolE2 [Gammaproteobacteria bacterium]|jgi:GTP cyclohydrolase IB|nr:GTP cyclohydrolase I FolE2 [Gammaproteobacteria bacterium]MBT7603080.1 GTP cyclohydrolase I FolE2 [Gammaproteobacteria bacterium]
MGIIKEENKLKDKTVSKELQDTQNKVDVRSIPINRVGIKDIKYPFQISDKNGEIQTTVGTFTMSVGLPHDVKGTHMSRFVKILEDQKDFISIENFDQLVKNTTKILSSESAYISVDFTYFKKKSAPVSRVESLLDYSVNFTCEVKNNIVNKYLKVIVPVTSLCPCSKNISDYGAHNQRSHISAHIRIEKTVWIDDVIEILENQASCQIYGLLKRPDEKYVTEQAYDNPKFTEDIIRDLAVTLNKDDRITAYKIESENFESIHNHSAYAYIEKDKKKDVHNSKNSKISYLKFSQLHSNFPG